MKSDALKLLGRAEFRDAVLARDGGRCVLCGRADGKLDAHHVMERRLFAAPAEAGGYFLDNGATLCDPGCHLLAEQTLASTADVRAAAGIGRVVLPAHLYADTEYDKWGNAVLPDGTRTRGELFGDESVHRVLAAGGALALFRDRVKYPRTHHLPFSPGAGPDDRVMPSTDALRGRRVVATLKMDGENTTVYPDGTMHARSVDSRSNPTRHHAQNLASKIGFDLPPGWRLCGENLYAAHTICYDRLPAYFMAFAVWDDRNECLPWDETAEWAALLGVPTVPVLYDGPWDEATLRALHRPQAAGHPAEGFVVRDAGRFTFASFPSRVGKYVDAAFARRRDATAHGRPLAGRNGLADL